MSAQSTTVKYDCEHFTFFFVLYDYERLSTYQRNFFYEKPNDGNVSSSDVTKLNYLYI